MMEKMDTPVNRGVCLALYAGAVCLGVTKKKWWPLCGLAALHGGEFVAVGNKVGEKAGIPFGKRLLSCMLYGIAWWHDIKAAQEGTGK